MKANSRPSKCGALAWRFGVGFFVVVALASTPALSVSAVAGWIVVPSPNVIVRHGSLAGVSCASAASCEAVGSSTNRAGAGVVLAEAWNGTTWSIQPTPNPTGATYSTLTGIACSSVSTCTAVGSYYNGSNTLTLVEVWNGTTWAIESTPNPAANSSVLNGISCSAANACMAVGAADGSTLVEAWNGTTWSQSTGTGGSLAGVSCTAATACTAVGSSGNLAFAEAWDGTSWNVQSIPNPSGTVFSSLGGVACSTASACTAVGSYFNGSAGKTLAEIWNGTTWSIQPTPNPSGNTYGSLGGVACPTASACTAVGSYSKGSISLAFAEAWNGTTWKVQSTPNPSGTISGLLSGVSCNGATACAAVGSYGNGFVPMNLAESWNGTKWSLQRPVGPLGEVPTGLRGVSCSTTTACAAVGGINTLRGARGTPQRMVAEIWNGTKWIFEATAKPAGMTYSNLSGVACPTTSYCIAVGNYFTSSGGLTLAEAWNGTSWSVQPTPNPAGGTFGGGLSAVSCTSATACVAVGSYNNGTALVTLAEVWNGTSWSIQPTPNPAGAGFSTLAGVSCVTASACTAVGSYFDGSNYLSLAEAWNGASWSIQSTPNPSGATFSSLSGVACPTANYCTAVGSSNGATSVALAEAWNGSTWSLQTVPTPSGGTSPSLSGVSCTTATQCTAVGSYSNAGFTATLTLAEAWNGASWTIQPTPNPAGAQAGVLTGISCPTATRCMAVGASAGVTEKTLAEEWFG